MSGLDLGGDRSDDSSIGPGGMSDGPLDAGFVRRPGGGHVPRREGGGRECASTWLRVIAPGTRR